MKIFGVIGYPLKFTLSPWMMMEVARRENLRISYHTFPIQPERLQQGLKALLALGIHGFQVTHPFKEKILPFLSEIDPEASSIGAVNTVVISSGEMTGYNTDVYGFEKGLEEWREREKLPLPERGIILGTGGAARAAASALPGKGIHPVFISRNPADELLVQNQRCPVYPYSELSTLLRHPALLVNATPLGSFPEVNELPLVPLNIFTPAHLVYDLNYYPLTTRLMEEAKKRGCPVQGGISMLFHQASRSLQIWTGSSAEDTFGQLYREILEGKITLPHPRGSRRL